MKPKAKITTRTARLGPAWLLLLVMLAWLGACEKEGPAERAGKQIDEAVDKAGDAVEDATD